MSDLKPCPFCGQIPTTEVRVTQMGGGEDHIDFTVVCGNCGTYKTSRLKLIKTGVFMDAEKAMQEAICAWNRRAINEIN